jgi:hypothetical protein
MSKSILIAMAAGIVVLAVAVGAIFRVQRGAHIELIGKILKVRTAPIDEDSSVAAVDFRVTNPADYPFVVQKVTLTAIGPGGGRTEGDTISEMDAKRLFDAIPLLGPKYNQTLLIHERVPPHTTIDRMASARFEVPDSKLQARTNLILRVDEIDGRAVAEFSEK